jgi:hypothetical protein
MSQPQKTPPKNLSDDSLRYRIEYLNRQISHAFTQHRPTRAKVTTGYRKALAERIAHAAVTLWFHPTFENAEKLIAVMQCLNDRGVDLTLYIAEAYEILADMPIPYTLPDDPGDNGSAPAPLAVRP